VITNYLDTVKREWHLREPQGVMDYVHPLRAVCTHDLTDCSFQHRYDPTLGTLCPGCKAAQGWTWRDPRKTPDGERSHE
jgi:hypothetical protein